MRCRPVKVRRSETDVLQLSYTTNCGAVQCLCQDGNFENDSLLKLWKRSQRRLITASVMTVFRPSQSLDLIVSGIIKATPVGASTESLYTIYRRIDVKCRTGKCENEVNKLGYICDISCVKSYELSLEGTHRVRTHATLLYPNRNNPNIDLWPLNPQTMSLLGYLKVIPYTEFEHFGKIRFWVMLRILVRKMHFIDPVTLTFQPKTMSLLAYTN